MAVAVSALMGGCWLVGAAGPAVAGGGCHATTLTDQTGTKVGVRELCFAPTVIRIAPGASVTWTNDDPTAHTVTGVAGTWGTYDSLDPGASVTYRFERSGVFPYFCVIHPGMVGAVVVGSGRSAGTTGQGAVALTAPSTAPPPARAHASADEALCGRSPIDRCVLLVAQPGGGRRRPARRLRGGRGGRPGHPREIPGREGRGDGPELRAFPQP
jgi:plastocyanin